MRLGDVVKAVGGGHYLQGNAEPRVGLSQR